MALEERSPETSPGWVKSEAWLKVGVQRVTGVESLRIKESKDTLQVREVRRNGVFLKASNSKDLLLMLRDAFPGNPLNLAC